MGLSKEELLKKLEAISSLHKKALHIKEKMINFEPEDIYERKVVVPVFPGEYEDEEEREDLEDAVDHTDDDAVEQMAEEFDSRYCPREPQKPDAGERPEPTTTQVDAYKQSKGCLPIVAGFVAVCSLISGGLFAGEFLTVILNVIIIAACVVVVLAFMKKMNALKAEDEKATQLALKQYAQRKEEQAQAHEQDMQAYQSRLNAYKLRRADFIDKYIKWRDVYLESLKEEDEIEEKLEADRVAAVKKIEDEQFTPALNELNALNDLVTVEYLPALDIIIDLLRSGRADDLKEAINLYEDLVYRERQLQLEREKEEQRRYEEEMRREAEERHHQEQMAFQERQEYNRRCEAEATERRHREEMQQREQQERDRLYAERKQREDDRRKQERAELERKQAEDQATRRQCNTCALCGKCSMSFRRPNCASYRPR